MILALLLAWYAVLCVRWPGVIGDELYHVPAIEGILAGDWTRAWALPMPPVFHALVAGAAGLVGTDLWLLRGVSLLIGIAAIRVYWAALSADGRPGDATALFQFAALPLLLPFWVLVYTDMLALLTVLVALACHGRGWRLAAALALLVGMLVRQSNAIWPLVFIGWHMLEHWGEARPATADAPRTPARLGRALVAARGAWPYALALLCGSAFNLVENPLTSDQPAENRPTFNIAQVFGLGMTLALIWAAVWVPHVPSLWRGWLARGLVRAPLAAALVAVAGGLAVLYRNQHGWNGNLDYVRNWPLVGMSTYPLLRIVMAALIVLFVATCAHWAYQRGAARAAIVWIVGLIYLAPHGLVDPRYYIVPVVLADFAMPYTPTERRRLVAWYATLTLLLALMMYFRPAGAAML